jgi:hypothetical protein
MWMMEGMLMWMMEDVNRYTDVDDRGHEQVR